MKHLSFYLKVLLAALLTCALSSCANMRSPQPDTDDGGDHVMGQWEPYRNYSPAEQEAYNAHFTSKMPATMETHGEKLVVVDPNEHAWGAYDKNGQLVRAGVATSGGEVCPPDADEANCRTDAGTFRITSVGDDTCASKKYPRPHGGGLMPYCMYFHNGEALHGSPDDIVREENLSHGCVRMRIPDAEWMSTQFASVGTKVTVLPYNQ